MVLNSHYASYPYKMAPATRIIDAEPRALVTQHSICLILELSILNYDPYPTHSLCVLVRTVN
jgi:hypothetical protein